LNNPCHAFFDTSIGTEHLAFGFTKQINAEFTKHHTSIPSSTWTYLKTSTLTLGNCLYVLKIKFLSKNLKKIWNFEKFKWADVLVNSNSVTFEVKKTIVGECLKYWGGIFSEKDWRSDYVNPTSGQVLFEMFKLIRNSCVTIL